MLDGSQLLVTSLYSFYSTLHYVWFHKCNVKLTLELNPSNFLQIKLAKINGFYKFNICWKRKKAIFTLDFVNSNRYKRNSNNGDFDRSNFSEEVPLIKEKFQKDNYSLCFINSVTDEFQKGKYCADKSFIIFSYLSGITKPFTSVKMSHYQVNEIKSKHFLKKLHKFSPVTMVSVLKQHGKLKIYDRNLWLLFLRITLHL